MWSVFFRIDRTSRLRERTAAGTSPATTQERWRELLTRRISVAYFAHHGLGGGMRFGVPRRGPRKTERANVQANAEHVGRRRTGNGCCGCFQRSVGRTFRRCACDQEGGRDRRREGVGQRIRLGLRGGISRGRHCRRRARCALLLRRTLLLWRTLLPVWPRLLSGAGLRRRRGFLLREPLPVLRSGNGHVPGLRRRASSLPVTGLALLFSFPFPSSGREKSGLRAARAALSVISQAY